MSFSEVDIQKVWEKGTTVDNVDSSQWRKDQLGAWIYRGYYGKRDNDYGWEIDHIRPVSDGGSDDIGNLRPLQWENNAYKQDRNLTGPITSEGNKNIRKF